MKQLKFMVLCMIFVALFSCENSNKIFSIIENRKEIISFINSNIRSTGFPLKGIESLGLSEQEAKYHKARLSYFKAILNNDIEQIHTFRKLQSEYYEIFPFNQKYIFYNSRASFDRSLMNQLKERFGEIYFTIDFMNEYYNPMVFNWD